MFFVMALYMLFVDNKAFIINKSTVRRDYFEVNVRETCTFGPDGVLRHLPAGANWPSTDQPNLDLWVKLMNDKHTNMHYALW